KIVGPLSLTGTINLPAWTQIAGTLSVIGPATVNLSPGTYWITDGSLTLSGNITLSGAGVTIIFTTTKGSAGTIGTLSETGNVTTILNAPGSGPYAGLLMVQDTVANASGGTIGNAASLDGLMYFPNTNLSFVGNIETGTSNCLVAVAKSLSLMGNIGLKASGCPTAGPTTPPTILSVFLAA